ncbi:hypothetical protein PQQ53_09900 [Paraburkholderia strydomiana]|jgi:hypothetical protein|uniref:Uncharacterized protein n=1 Tax=Paraburkholderia strydomiana TaxID=1245417 RepID=A0ABW9E649_9BURK
MHARQAWPKVSLRSHLRGAIQHFAARSFPEVFPPSVAQGRLIVACVAHGRLSRERLREIAGKRGFTFV